MPVTPSAALAFATGTFCLYMAPLFWATRGESWDEIMELPDPRPRDPGAGSLEAALDQMWTFQAIGHSVFAVGAGLGFLWWGATMVVAG